MSFLYRSINDIQISTNDLSVDRRQSMYTCIGGKAVSSIEFFLDERIVSLF